jgi:dihydrofolate reductase
MNLIVAVDENMAIGYKGDLLIKISSDLKYFKKITTGHNVVMGRITYESLPGKKLLPNRTNIILTHVKSYCVPGAVMCHCVDEVLHYAQNSDLQTFIIGGQAIYNIFLPHIKKAYITQIYAKFDADKHIPNFIQAPQWTLISESDMMTTESGISYQFLVYERT